MWFYIHIEIAALVFHVLLVQLQVTGKSITGLEETLTDEVKAGIKGCRVCWRGMDSGHSCSGYSQQGFNPTNEVPWFWEVAYWIECENSKENTGSEFEGELEVAEPFALKGCLICWRGYDTSEARSCSKYSHDTPLQPTGFVPFNWDVAFWLECQNLNNKLRDAELTNNVIQLNTYETADVPRLLSGCRVCWIMRGGNRSCSGYSHQGPIPTAFVEFNWDVSLWIECLRENHKA